MNIRSIFKIKLIILLLIIPLNLNAKEFLNTIMHINFGIMFGFPFGDMIDHERSTFHVEEKYKGKTSTLKPDHYDTSFGVTVDLSPFPSILLGNEAHAIKFGIRGAYRFHFVQQKLVIREDASYKRYLNSNAVDASFEKNNTKDDIDYSGNLIRYQSWMVGPVIHYAPFVKTDNFEEAYTAIGGFTFFVLFGQIHEGTLTAYTARRNSKVDSPVTYDYKTSFTAFKVDAGMGAEIGICSMNIGINLFYSYINYKLVNRSIYPKFDEGTILQEVNIEIYVGIPIVWFKSPKII